MQRSAEPAPKRPLSVLVIDDEDYVADMIASILRLEHFQVWVAYNGREGLAVSQQQVFDLVLVDIMMPHLGGIELIQSFVQTPKLQHLPIILMSAGARPQQNWPHVTFLAKPFLIEDLVGLVMDTIGDPLQ